MNSLKAMFASVRVALHDSTTHSLRSMRSSLAGNQNKRSEIGRESDKSMTSGKARRCVPNQSAILLSTDDGSCGALVPFVSLATVLQKRQRRPYASAILHAS